MYMYIICPPHLVPHGVPCCQAAVPDAGLTAHHGLAGWPVSGGVTEPPPVSEKTLEKLVNKTKCSRLRLSYEECFEPEGKLESAWGTFRELKRRHHLRRH